MERFCSEPETQKLNLNAWMVNYATSAATQKHISRDF